MSKRRKKIKLLGEIGRFSYFLSLLLLFYFYCFVLCRRVKARKVAFLWRVRLSQASISVFAPRGSPTDISCDGETELNTVPRITQQNVVK
jgi:hypothetical protein